MKAKISTAYHEVTVVIITYLDNSETRVTFEGELHFNKAWAYTDWINQGCKSYLISGGWK